MNEQSTFHDQVVVLRRGQILDAATRVFAARGFHRTTIRDVAREAGVADGTIYNYFENKAALLLGILDRLNESDRRADDLAQVAGGDTRSAMAAYIRQRLGVMAGQLEVFQVVLSEVLVNPELRDIYLRSIITPTFELAEARFAPMAEAGLIRPINVAMDLRISAATTLGLLMLRILGEPLVTARWDDLPDILADAMYENLRPRES
jgi:AcrR family transcriptional regulator